MKKVVCELCEGTEFFKEGAMFVCRGCGTSYTAEQARALMQDVADSSPAPAAAAPAPMPSQQLENILVLASAACEASNYNETESYCNKAIELDAKCYEAWFMKGKAVGWQSKIGNLRIEEAAHSFCKAIDFAPVEEKESLKNLAAEEIRKLGIALISLRKDRFSGTPDAEELNGFTTDQKTVLDALIVLLEHGNAVGIPDGYLEEIATLMNEAAVGALNMARRAWVKVDHPGEKDFDTYLGWMSNIAQLLRQAITVSDKDDEADMVRYQNLIIVLKEPMDACSYKREWDSWKNEYVWVVDYTLSNSAKEARRKEMEKCKSAIAAIKRKKEQQAEEEKKAAEEAKAQRIEAYWAEHKAEKDVLESEKAQLTDQKGSLENEILDLNKQIKAIDAEKNESVPSRVEEYKLHEQVRELYNQKCNLGVFAVKEKKQITEKITALENEISVLRRKAQEETKDQMEGISKKIAPLKAKRDEVQNELAAVSARIAAIETELTKDRS